MRWLRANKERFRMEVFEPPALSVTVPNVAFAAAVEKCFNAAQMKVRLFTLLYPFSLRFPS